MDDMPFSDLKSHTQTNRQGTQGPIDRHIHVNIYEHYLLCAHSNYLHYTE